MNSAEKVAALQMLESVVGAPHVHAWETLTPTKRAAIESAVAPTTSIKGIICPKTPAEVAAVLAIADRYDWCVLPCGAGSKLNWGGVIGGQTDAGSRVKDEALPLLLVSTERLNGLIDHAIGDLTVTVEAGMRFAALQSALAQAGQFLAIDPSYPDQATIGGIVATADTGSLRQRYNSVRDMLLGLSFVRADGQFAKAGGRVVKNVAGYDLMKLFTGSYGTLGVITQVTFRVYPLPEAAQTVVLSGSAETIAEATQTLLRSALTPSCADVLSDSVATALGLPAEIALAVRFQSILPSVQEQAKRLVEVGQVLGLTSTVLTASDDAALWHHLQERLTTANQPDAITCKIGISPSEAVALWQYLDALSIAPWFGQIHVASGIGRLVLDAATSPEALLKIRSFCQTNGGFLSVLQASIAFKQSIDVWGYVGNALELMQTLKQQFDPNSCLSPHRFIGGI